MTIHPISQAANPASKRPHRSSARHPAPRLNWLRPNLHPSAQQQQQTMEQLYKLALAAAEAHGLA